MCMHPLSRCVRAPHEGQGRVCSSRNCASGDWCSSCCHSLRSAHAAGQCGSAPHRPQKRVPHEHATSAADSVTRAAAVEQLAEGHQQSSAFASTKERRCSMLHAPAAVPAGRHRCHSSAGRRTLQSGCGHRVWMHPAPDCSAVVISPPQQSEQNSWPHRSDSNSAGGAGGSKQMPHTLPGAAAPPPSDVASAAAAASSASAFAAAAGCHRARARASDAFVSLAGTPCALSVATRRAAIARGSS
mmetsp:Transcript_39112/g.123467  ORF Transcript_39112/g.123467 Transcript_39112/m.123467 type:complete len:243 (-) Transcript_39112:359-1087(-)